jgi:L-iditol 2-dehydrogenase
MNALMLSEYRRLKIEDQPVPVCGETEVLIQIAACGICGSDVHGYDGSSGRRIPPIVMGHEAAGTIAAVGHQVRAFAPGERVTFDSTIYCAQCEFCLRGEVNLCEARQVVGVSCADYRRAGAFAEYVAVPEHVVYRLPPTFSFADAAMLEAVSVALHAVKLARIEPGDTALVIGAGMIGLLLLQAARTAGCSRVFVADIEPTRLNLASILGADEAIQTSQTNLIDQILRLTNGRRIDAVFEAVGREETVAAAIDCVRKGGVVTLVGNIASQVSIPLQKVVTRQIRLQGSCASAGEYPEAIELVAGGKIKVAPMITAIAPLSDGPEWFERLYAREPNLMKVILDPRPCASSAPGPALRGSNS